MKLKFDKTSRNFSIIDFIDADGRDCTIQKSSAADRDCIWFGLDDAIVTNYKNSLGTPEPFTLPDGVVAFSRMHLTQAQVKKLLPIIQHFAYTGEVPRSMNEVAA